MFLTVTSLRLCNPITDYSSCVVIIARKICSIFKKKKKSMRSLSVSGWWFIYKSAKFQSESSREIFNSKSVEKNGIWGPQITIAYFDCYNQNKNNQNKEHTWTWPKFLKKIINNIVLKFSLKQDPPNMMDIFKGWLGSMLDSVQKPLRYLYYW